MILLKLDANVYFAAHVSFKLDGWIKKTNRAPPVMQYQALYIISKLAVN